MRWLQFSAFVILFSHLGLSQSSDCPQDLLDNLQWEFRLQPGVLPLEPGESFYLECHVSGFQDVASFQYTFGFDPTVLQFDSLDDTGSPLTGSVENNVTEAATGNLGLLWSNLNGFGESHPDGTAIYKLFFTVVGNPGDCSYVNFTSNIVGLEVYFTFPDGSDCFTIIDLNISTDVPLKISCIDLAVIPSYCADTNGNGTLTIEVCGGTPPYSISVEGNTSGALATNETITDPSGIFILNNVAPDLYVIEVNDGAGGNFFTQYDISSASVLEVDVFVIDPPKCDGLKGDIGGTALGGNPPYSYAWSNGVFATETQDNVPEGTYILTVTDATGCEATGEVTMDVLDFTFGVSTVDATCTGTMDGSALVTVSGGTPYAGGLYDYDNGAGPSLIGEFTNLNPGIYNITIQDANFCALQVEFEILGDFVADYVVDTLSTPECFGEFGEYVIRMINDTISTSLGTPLIQDQNGNFPLYGVNPMTDFTTIEFFSDLFPGAYDVEFTLNNGCVVEFVMEIPEYNFPEIVIDLVETVNPGCNGELGSIDVMSSGGTGALSFEWSDGSMTEDVMDLDNGTYTLTVTDENFCSSTFEVDMSGMGALNIEAVVVQTVGCGDDANSGIVEVNIIGGAASNPTFNWENSAGTVLGDDSTLDGVGAGTYFVTVTGDDPDCPSVADVSIDGAGNFFFEEFSLDPTCFRGDEGSIEITLDGGVPPFDFAWSHDTNLTFNTAEDLTAGDYNVTVTDSDGCEKDTTITLVDPPPMDLEIDPTSIVGVSCFGRPDGQATAIASNSSIGATDFIYYFLDEDGNQIDEVTGMTGFTQGLPAGTISYYAYDGQCFSDTLTFVIPGIEQIQIDSSTSEINGIMCAGESEGALSIDITGGTGIYNYEWDTGATTNEITNIQAGDYVLTVTDENDCAEIFTFQVEEPDSLIVGIDPFLTTAISCFGTNSATIGIFAEGGSGPYTYDWTPEVSTSNTAINLAVGDYTIVVTDAVGCEQMLEYTIGANEPIEASLAPYAELDCPGDSTLVCLELVTGGTGFGYVYQVNFGNIIPTDSCFFALPGQYEIVVLDSEGCQAVNPLEVDIPQPPALTIDLGDDLLVDLGSTEEIITANINSASPIDSIAWFSENGEWECEDEDCTSIIISPLNPAFYSIEVIDVNGCSGFAEIFVDVKKTRNVYVPTIFNPDGQGLNESFVPFLGPGALQINTFNVYDRWGNAVHSVDTPILPGFEIVDAWDGRYQGQELNPGVYVYIAEIEFIDGVVEIWKGSITLYK